MSGRVMIGIGAALVAFAVGVAALIFANYPTGVAVGAGAQMAVIGLIGILLMISGVRASRTQKKSAAH